MNKTEIKKIVVLWRVKCCKYRISWSDDHSSDGV